MTPPPRPRSLRARAREFVAELEPRRLFVTYTGTEGPDTIIIRAPAAGAVSVTINGTTQTTIDSSIIIVARGGNDTVYFPVLMNPARPAIGIQLGDGDDYATNYDPASGVGSFANIRFGAVINGGNGNDTLSLDNTHGPAGSQFRVDPPPTFGGQHEIRVSTGNALGVFDYPLIENVTLDGSGFDDTFILEAKRPEVRLTANGRNGNDRFSAGSYVPGPEGGSARAYSFSYPENGWLAGTATLTGGGGVDSITFEDRRHDGPSAYVADNFTFTRAGHGFTYSGFETQALFAGRGAAVQVNAVNGSITSTTLDVRAAEVNLHAAPTAVRIDAALGSTVNVGNGNLAGFAGPITVVGDDHIPNGAVTPETVRVFNAASSASATVEVFSDRVSLARGGLQLHYAGVGTLDLRCGMGNDFVTVRGTPAGTRLFAYGGSGNDALALAPSVTGGLGAPVVLEGGPGTDDVRLDYSEGSTLIDAVLTATTFAAAFGGPAGSPGAAAGPTHTYLLAETVGLYYGAGGSRTIVSSMAVPLSVTGSGGDEVMVVGGGDLDANFAPGATVFFDGGNPPLLEGQRDNDRVEFDDRADRVAPGLADEYLIDLYRVPVGVPLFYDRLTKRGGPADVVVDAWRVEQRVLNASDDASTIRVDDAGNSALRIEANGGDDAVSVADASAAVPEVVMNTGAGRDTLDVNSDAGAAGDVPAVVRVDSSDELAGLTVRPGGTLRVGRGAAVAVDAPQPATFGVLGVVDLAGGALVLRGAADRFASAFAMAKAGYNGGAWDGAGGLNPDGTAAGAVHSSLAASTRAADAVGVAVASAVRGQRPSALFGVAVAPSDVLLRYTLVGDANLDGVVNVIDMARVRGSLYRGDGRWDPGNFNFDGSTTLVDYLAMRRNLGRRG